jgi:hypothetical protein
VVLTFCHKLNSLCVPIKSSGTVLNLGLLHEALKVFPRLSKGFDFTKLSVIPRHAFTHTCHLFVGLAWNYLEIFACMTLDAGFDAICLHADKSLAP